MSPLDLLSRLDFTRLLDQRGRMLQLESALPHLALVPESMQLREAVSQPFELVLDALGSSAHFELKTLIGEQLSVRLLQPAGLAGSLGSLLGASASGYKPFHGYVFEAAQLGSDGGLARYRLVMRPWLSFLALRRDSFVFQDLTVCQIVEDVFKDYACANFRFDTSLAWRPRSLCTQHRETDLDFVSRLLAEEGLSWHFEHLDEHADAAPAAKPAADTEAADKASPATPQARHVLVITDRSSPRPALGTVRFASQHPTANVLGQKDAITAFAAGRELQPNAVALGSWNYKQLAGTQATDSTALDIGELPELEAYDGSGAYRYADTEHAEEAAARALAAMELNFERFEGQGSARHFEAGRTFKLVDHPLFGANTTSFNYAGGLASVGADNDFVLLSVEHHATNNLGANAAALLQGTALERGSYKNHFHAARAAAPLVPRFRPKPTAPGLQTALVVGLPEQALSTERDLRVKIQFAWQRGSKPNPGGLAHTSPGDAVGNAPGSDASGTWVRVAQAAAGANWGSVFTPRMGSEVCVAFVEGDIDRPLITGGLFNGLDTPPFAAGVDSGVNHPGVIDGLHSQGLDGAGFNQWVLDNATGQLRMRLHTSYSAAELGLGHLIQQGAASALRGAWRGAGFEAGTQGWATLRAGRGLLLSATARAGSQGSAQSTQMDAAEALAQLKAAQALGARMGDAASAATAAPLPSHGKGQAFDAFIKSIDPAQDGKHPGPVNGQEAKKASGRELKEPVEAFDKPHILLDTPSSSVWASEAGIVAYAGQDLSLVAQGDLQSTAAHTVAQVSGLGSSWYTHEGGAKLHAANGPVSLRAHTDSLQILADQDVTVISVNDEITISASSKIELVAGQSSIVLKGGDITFTMPGNFTVKGSAHAFLDGQAQAASLPALPVGQLGVAPQEIELHFHYDDLSPVVGALYKVTFANGTVRQGALDSSGYALLSGVPKGAYTVEYGEDSRPWPAPPLPPDGAEFAKADVQAAGRGAIERMLAAHPVQPTDEAST